MENNNDILENQSTNLQDENRKSANNRLQIYAFILAVFLLLIFLIYTFVKSFNDNENKEIDKKDLREVRVKEKKFEFKPIKKEVAVPKQKEIPLPIAEPVKDKFEFKPMIKEKKFISKIIKGSTSSLLETQNKESSSILNEISNSTVLSENNIFSDNKNTENSSKGQIFTPMTTRLSEFDPDLLLSKGSYIGCSLNTQFISTLGGNISCTIGDNVYSSNGKVLLIEKGSRLFGSFKGGAMDDGMNRYFVIWQEVRTLNNLIIPLYSDSVDELGGSGLDGKVDHKWLVRFGAAVLLSTIDDALNVLTHSVTKKNQDVDYTENSRENAKNMAGIALESFINIKPTLYKNHGDIVGVYVNRDIDFSKVYRLKKIKK